MMMNLGYYYQMDLVRPQNENGNGDGPGMDPPVGRAVRTYSWPREGRERLRR